MKGTAFLLAVLLLLPLCVSCTDIGKSDKDTVLTSDTTSADTLSADELLDPKLNAIDGGGREFVVLCRSAEGYTFAHPEILAEEISGERVNDAIFERNNEISEKYNVIIVPVTNTAATIRSMLEIDVMSGTGLYDVALEMINNSFYLATRGVLLEWSNVPFVDGDKPYWRRDVAESTSISGYNFFAVGDINISAFNTVGVTFFNKKVHSELTLENPYELVKNGTWTFDKMAEMSRVVTSDLNGNGSIDPEDRFGLTVNAFVWQPFFYSSGIKLVTKDADDIPYLAVDTNPEKVYNILTGIVNLLNDKTSTILVNQYPQFASSLGEASIDMFSQDRALFWVEIIYGLAEIRNMENDFGILPMTKFDANQEEYMSYIHCSHSSGTVVPTTNNDLDLTGSILEDMAYISYLKVRPEFYEITITTKYNRDAESYEMLHDYIYENITMDLTLVMSNSGLAIDSVMRNMMISNNSNFTSLFAAQSKGYMITIEKLTNSIIEYGRRDTEN